MDRWGSCRSSKQTASWKELRSRWTQTWARSRLLLNKCPLSIKITTPLFRILNQREVKDIRGHQFRDKISLAPTKSWTKWTRSARWLVPTRSKSTQTQLSKTRSCKSISMNGCCQKIARIWLGIWFIWNSRENSLREKLTSCCIISCQGAIQTQLRRIN